VKFSSIRLDREAFQVLYLSGVRMMMQEIKLTKKMQGFAKSLRQRRRHYVQFIVENFS